MTKEKRIGSVVAVMLMSAALFSACGTIDLPCLLGDCPNADKCGNGVVDPGETCDIAIPVGQPGACPVSCGDGNPCTSGILTNAGTCTAMCTVLPCVCGDGIVETEETCDTAIPAGQSGACPTSCTAPDACTVATLTGTFCMAKCVYAPIVPCCGNGVVKEGEECDPPSTTCTSLCRIGLCSAAGGMCVPALSGICDAIYGQIVPLTCPGEDGNVVSECCIPNYLTLTCSPACQPGQVCTSYVGVLGNPISSCVVPCGPAPEQLCPTGSTCGCPCPDFVQIPVCM